MIYVVGSGPAGVACASALLERGAAVEMIDAGVELELAHAAVVKKMAAVASEAWDPSWVRLIKSNMVASTRGVSQKIAYGSDFPYKQIDDFYPTTLEGVHLLPSLARGGLSNVWGAAILPHRAEELDGWPIQLADLEPHYRAVMKVLPLAASRDALETFFPLYSDNFDQLELSQQASRLLKQLAKNAAPLNEAGIHFGGSRLAVHSRSQNGKAGCTYCGLCMYGCPYQSIYSSQETLQQLMRQPKFKYTPDVVVQRIEETADGLTLIGEKRMTRAPIRLKGSQCFLAAGILPTTKILLESLQAFDQPLPMVYSQHFMFPLLNWRGPSSVTQEKLYTLSQLFLEVMDPEISRDTIHLQIYSYNDLFAQALGKSMLGPIFKVLPPLREWTLSKLLIVQGYLHSRHSSPIQVQLTREGFTGFLRLVLKGEIAKEIPATLKRLLKKLSKTRGLHGMVPVGPMLRISPPGEGFHNAGTFPMKQRPEAFQSDALGRIHGYKRLHAVDATVLPSAPASTITLSVMANAHRIGSNAELH